MTMMLLPRHDGTLPRGGGNTMIGTVVAAALAASTFGAPDTLVIPPADSVTVATVQGRASLGYDQLRPVGLGQAVHVDGFALDDGRSLDLRLERFDVLAPGATVVVVDGDRQREVRPPVVLLRGTVAGKPDSQVVLGIAPDAVNGFVRLADGMHVVSSHPGERPDLAVTDMRHLEIGSAFCGYDPHDPVLNPDGPAIVEMSDHPLGSTAPCRVVKLAIETDYEFTNDLFGGSTNAAAAYAMTLIGAASEIYANDVNVRLMIGYMRLWTENDDPYSAGGLSSSLNEFRDTWEQMWQIDRDLAHMLSGRTIGGGIAWLGSLCRLDLGYSVAGNLNGSFPLPLEDNHDDNWDVIVVAHELGHNLGSGHTHDSYVPPIDGCGQGVCGSAENGTIMSYCHQCDGGISNIRLGFHPRVIDRILDYLDDGATCNVDSGANAVDDKAITGAGVPVLVDVLLNDLAVSCEEPVIGTVVPTTDAGGTVELVPADQDFPRDRLRITPGDVDGSELTRYVLVGGSVGSVKVEVRQLRAADEPGALQAGLDTAYYALSAPSALPDFEQLTPYATDAVSQLSYASTDGDFVTSGRDNEVGAVFTGYVEVASAGDWTFYTESDDGSRLFIGEDAVVDNDGLHGMAEEAGTIGLDAGLHEIRVEFFENGGGAGLLVRYQGPGQPKSIVPPAAWFRPASCAADLTGEGLVGFSDLSVLLQAWGACGAVCPEDLDGDGDVGFTDLAALLAIWGPC
jgi:hypothetical protein